MNLNMDSESIEPTDILLMLVLVGISIFGAYLAITAYLDYNSDTAKVDGTVVSSEVDRDTGGRRGGVSYYADIKYEYTYDGENYTSENIKPGSGRSSLGKSKAESLVSNYSEGNSITVYVKANDPSTSWIMDRLPLKTIIVSGLFSVLGLGMLYKKYLHNMIEI